MFSINATAMIWVGFMFRVRNWVVLGIRVRSRLCLSVMGSGLGYYSCS